MLLLDPLLPLPVLPELQVHLMEIQALELSPFHTMIWVYTFSFTTAATNLRKQKFPLSATLALNGTPLAALAPRLSTALSAPPMTRRILMLQPAMAPILNATKAPQPTPLSRHPTALPLGFVKVAMEEMTVA